MPSVVRPASGDVARQRAVPYMPACARKNRQYLLASMAAGVWPAGCRRIEWPEWSPGLPALRIASPWPARLSARGRTGFDRMLGSGSGVPWLISRPR